MASSSARRDADFEPTIMRGVSAGMGAAHLRAASSVISGGGASAALRVERAAISARRRCIRGVFVGFSTGEHSSSLLC